MSPRGKKKNKQKKKTSLDCFIEEFCEELDILSCDDGYPAWVLRYREEMLGRLSREVRSLCRRLKSLGYRFKVKWPVVNGGKWKYADFWLPGSSTAVCVFSGRDYLLPPWACSEKLAHFAGSCAKAVELCEFFSDEEIIARLGPPASA